METRPGTVEGWEFNDANTGMSSTRGARVGARWPEKEGYIQEDEYPLTVVHQDDSGYILLLMNSEDGDSLIVAYSIDFDYGPEGAVAREDIAGQELAPYRRVSLESFFEVTG